MTPEQVARAHQAAKMIETDGPYAYYSCRERFGEEVANALLVLFLRLQYNPQGQYPPPETLVSDVNKALEQEHILAKTIPPELPEWQ